MARIRNDEKMLKSTVKTAATLTDVAKRAGVSQVAASVVLNGAKSTVRVSPETRRRLEQVALEMNYHPNAVARGLLRGRMNTLGVLFNTIQLRAVSNTYSMGILQGIMNASAVADYNVTLFTKPAGEIEQSTSFMRDRRTDGVLVIAPNAHSPVVKTLAAQGIPVIAVSSWSEEHGVPSVDVDNALGARLAVEHLLTLGHRRIAHLMGPENQSDASIRSETYRHILAAAGIPPPPEYLVPTNYMRGDAYKAVRALLASQSPPTAIFAVNDDIAEEVILAAADSGVRIPEQLSLVGFDDLDAEKTNPPLTTVRHPLEMIGELATRLILALVDGDFVATTTHLVQPELIVRSSTAPPATTP